LCTINSGLTSCRWHWCAVLGKLRHEMTSNELIAHCRENVFLLKLKWNHGCVSHTVYSTTSSDCDRTILLLTSCMILGWSVVMLSWRSLQGWLLTLMILMCCVRKTSRWIFVSITTLVKSRMNWLYKEHIITSLQVTINLWFHLIINLYLLDPESFKMPSMPEIVLDMLPVYNTYWQHQPQKLMFVHRWAIRYHYIQCDIW